MQKIDAKEFIEYTDNGDSYVSPERSDAAAVLDIRLYCDSKGCKQYIKGKEGYNGMFTAETGQRADLRNQTWICTEHDKNS